jgi:hypothetical protein
MPDAYLRIHPPRRSQYRSPRRSKPSGVIVVHTAESVPDTVATDGGAEGVANFIKNRETPGSYHDLCDSDSSILMVRYEDEAFQDGTGSNPHALSVSAATRADFWPFAPASWRARTLQNMAKAAQRQAAWVKAETGIVVPARIITRTQSESRIPGFISHGARDPGRRSDPGFRPEEWDLFFYYYQSGDGMTEFTDADRAKLGETHLRTIELQQKVGEMRAMFDSNNVMGELRRNLRRVGKALGIPGDYTSIDDKPNFE